MHSTTTALDQQSAISVLADEAMPYGQMIVDAAVASGEWSQTFADRNDMARRCALGIARDAYRNRISVERAAAKLGLIEAPAQAVAA